MIVKIEKEFIDYNVNPDSDLIIAVVQIPVEWERNGNFVSHKYPEKQWELIKQTLEEIKKAKFYGRTIDIAIFPELAIPSKYIDELKIVVGEFNSNFILLSGFDYVSLENFIELLNNSDNSNKTNYIAQLKDQNSDLEKIKKIKPVNFCSIIIKSDNEVKQYFQSKIFPSKYEQTRLRHSEILKGEYLLNFETKIEEYSEKKRLRKFSFIPLICFDQLYEKTEAGESIIERLITHTDNEGPLEFIFILQYNPRMDHVAIEDALCAYYLYRPTRSLRSHTYTFFVNVSDKCTKLPETEAPSYGSLVVFHKKAEFDDTSEHKLTKIGHENLHKMEFINSSNRLYFLKCALLSNYQENPTSARNPIEILQTNEYMNNRWEYIYPEKVKETIEDDPNEIDFADLISPMLDMYCSDIIIKKFDEGILENCEIINELIKNELLIVLRRGYEFVRKEQIPKKLIEKMEQVLNRLLLLEKVKNKKLADTLDKKFFDELSTIGSNIQKNKEIINYIIRDWDSGR